MHEILHERTAHLARLAGNLHDRLQAAEASIPAINQHLAQLAAVGVTDFQIEGPVIYSRPAGVSSAHVDEFLIFQAAIILPGGVGALTWGSTEYHEHVSLPYGEPVDLAPRFTPYAQCPPLVRAMLISHTGRMLESLMGGHPAARLIAPLDGSNTHDDTPAAQNTMHPASACAAGLFTNTEKKYLHKCSLITTIHLKQRGSWMSPVPKPLTAFPGSLLPN